MSRAKTNPAGNGQVDEAGQQTGETRRVGCRWAAERMGGGHTGLRGDLGTHCKHLLTARFPSPFRESEVLMGWAGLGLVWSPKSPSASFVEVGCLNPSLSLHPNLGPPSQALWRTHIFSNIPMVSESRALDACIPMASSSSSSLPCWFFQCPAHFYLLITSLEPSPSTTVYLSFPSAPLTQGHCV